VKKNVVNAAVDAVKRRKLKRKLKKNKK